LDISKNHLNAVLLVRFAVWRGSWIDGLVTGTLQYRTPSPKLPDKGDDLARISALVDFEAPRPEFVKAIPRSNLHKGGRLASDHVWVFKMLSLQAKEWPVGRAREYLSRIGFFSYAFSVSTVTVMESIFTQKAIKPPRMPCGVALIPLRGGMILGLAEVAAMTELLLLTEEQMSRISPHFP